MSLVMMALSSCAFVSVAGNVSLFEGSTSLLRRRRKRRNLSAVLVARLRSPVATCGPVVNLSY
jgi:hypothetical protein